MPSSYRTTAEVTVPLNSWPQGRNSRPMRNSKKSPQRKNLVLILIVVVVILVIVGIGIYFLWKFIESKYFFCSRSVKFIPLEKTCDGNQDCLGEEDELSCVNPAAVTTTFPVRLISNQSVLQVFSPDSGWKSVCSDGWTSQHTQTACKQLGYTNNPSSNVIPVSSLTTSLRNGKFATVKPGTSNTPTDQATNDSRCSSGKVVSLTCSDCGKVTEIRIVGGRDTLIDHWPWQVSLQQGGQHKCGGSLVSPRWVVTAAHCFQGGNRELSRWRVVSGHTSLTSGGSTVDRVLINQDYNPARQDYDIALMRLTTAITVSNTQKPVCLPPKDLGVPPESDVYVTGWGYLREESKVSQTLQEAKVSLLSRDTCSRPEIYGTLITNRMICAGVLRGGVDACQGDSGGPLVHSSANRWNLIGVVSWGIGCARQNKPGVYSNVDELLNWIYTSMQKNP